MIEVIKHGQKKFKTICANCGCEFTYELSDILGGGVECPDCFHYVALGDSEYKILSVR